MKTVLEEVETAVATVVPHATTKQPHREVKPAVLTIAAETETESYPSCMDLAAEFMARG